MNKLAAFAAFNLALAVALGALGAHYLKAELSPESLNSFQTGVRYHVYHSLALLIIAGNPRFVGLKRQSLLMAIGMLFFSFSIYLLSTRGVLLSEGSARWLGPITPIGGVLLISSWTWMGFSFLRGEKSG